jgi:hypothetical protein
MTDQQPPWGAPPPPQPPPPQQWSQQPAPPPPGWGAPPPSGWGVPPVAIYGSSIWAIIAGIALLIWGLLWTLVGVVGLLFGNAANNIPGVPVGFDVGGFLAVIGIVFLVIGILHLIAAIFIWAHRDWARYLGLALAVLGTRFGLLSLPAALSPSSAQDGGIGGVLLLLVPYAVALIGLILGGDHFRRRFA